MRIARALVWALAIFVGLASARYFILSDAVLRAARPVVKAAAGDAGAAFGVSARARVPLLFLPHVGGGIVALIAGLFQFMPRLRSERPLVHRRIGMIYVAAVAAGSITGLPLSLLIPRLVPWLVRAEFLPMVGSFFVTIVTAGVLSWPLNLVVAEWLIRREPQPILVAAAQG